jgi:hypothetical protein
MEAEIRERTDAYIHARQHHPAWQLLAARRAPLILSCLQALFEQSQDGVGFDDALRALAEMLADHANAGEFEIGDEDFAAQARKELRSWIKLSTGRRARRARVRDRCLRGGAALRDRTRRTDHDLDRRLAYRWCNERSRDSSRA